MSFVWAKKNARNRIRQVKVDRPTLEKIADLLGIPQADRGPFHAGTIYVGPEPPQNGGKTGSSRGKTSRTSGSAARRPSRTRK